MYFLISIPFHALLIDGVIHAILFAILGIFLWNVLGYIGHEILLPVQRLINYTALILIIVSLWLGTGYLLDFLLLENTIVMLILQTFTVRGFIGLMLCVIIILSFLLLSKQSLQRNNSLNITPENQQEKIKENKTADLNEEIIERVPVRTGQRICFIPVQDIIYLQSDGDYVQIITSNEKHLKEQTMKFFEIHLPGKTFVRIHRSCIVNIDYIIRIEATKKQNPQIILSNGQCLKVSLSGYKALKSTLQL
jgi:hypothetical protein